MMMTLRKEDLKRFQGSEKLYRHFTGLLLTEGVKFLQDEAAAHWLVDIIASYQFDPRILDNPRLKGYQFWTLKVRPKEEGLHYRKAVLTCVEDKGVPPAITHEIDWTDFPLDELIVWVQAGHVDGKDVMIALLPSES
jgi:hypothetical protein